MKQLELQLQKRLLIVEGEDPIIIGQYEADVNGRHIELICKGSELTEETANKYVAEHEFYDGNRCQSYHGYKDYKYNDYALQSSIDSFISSIEAQGYYWGENPISLVRANTYRSMGDNFRADVIQRAWQESESKTFNLEMTFIFEIL